MTKHLNDLGLRGFLALEERFKALDQVFDLFPVTPLRILDDAQFLEPIEVDHLSTSVKLFNGFSPEVSL